MAIAGISAHKTTIYHSQQVSLLNAGWLADPVQTAAMSGAVSNSDPATAVMNAVQNGIGSNFRQYYPYATRRFKKRNCNYSLSYIQNTGSVEFGLNRKRLISLLPELDGKEFRIVQDTDTFSLSGAKTFQDMDTLFGWNDFTEAKPDGTNIVITGAFEPVTFLESTEPLKNSWIVGTELSQNLPVLILDPNINENVIKSRYYLLAKTEYTPEPSAGIVYWLSSKGFEPEKVGKKKKITYTETAFNSSGIDPNNLEPVETNRITDWENDNETSMTINTDVLPDNPNTGRDLEKIPIGQPIENVKIFYRQYSHSYTDKNNNLIHVTYEWEEEGKIVYDSEGYVWATEKEESHSGVRDYFKRIDDNITSKVSLKKKFKFYPYLPIKEYNTSVLDFKNTFPYLAALKKFNDKSKDNDTEDSPKTQRQGKKKDQKHSKTKPDRVLARKAKYERKMKVKGLAGITEKDERHLVQMGKLLNTDYKEVCSSLAINEDYDKIYSANIIPAIALGSNFDEVNDYWFKFMDNVLKNIDPLHFLKFETAVNNLPKNCTFKDVLSLPRIELSYGIENGQFGGFLSFAYIKKFKITGSIRTVKRKHRLTEVKSGLHCELWRIQGNDLKHYLTNPSKELQQNIYHTSSVSGRQYNCGTGNLHVNISAIEKPYEGKVNKASAMPIKQDINKAELMFSDFGYTFFCKDIGNNELEVIAVAGLIGGQTRTGYTAHDHGSIWLDGDTLAARANHELSMFWARNFQRYSMKVNAEKIDVKTTFTAGSRKRKLETNVQSFFIVPMDWRTVSRLSGTSIMRLSQRGIITLTWTKVRVRRLRGWVKTVLQIIGVIIAIVGTIYGGWGSAAGASIMGIAKAIAYAVIIQLVIKYGLQLLIKVFGLKGFLAIIIAVIVAVVAMAASGYLNISSLPYASQTATASIASNASTQIATQSVSQSVLNTVTESIKSAITNAIKEFTSMGLKESLKFSVELASKAADTATEYIGKETQKIAQQMEQASKEYDQHMSELQELQELNQQRTAPYDVKEVMYALMNKTKLYQPDNFLTLTLMSDNTLASEEFLSGFIESKLSLEPETFDSIGSLDFSLKMKG